MEVHDEDGHPAHHWVDQLALPQNNLEGEEPYDLVGQLEVLLEVVKAGFSFHSPVEDPIAVVGISEHDFRDEQLHEVVSHGILFAVHAITNYCFLRIASRFLQE
eukprot:CAMPEP_0170510556 /NCGR_PEP_ID=MMETSP0208-20121228/65831_1 /TAXON_ID=197538 /ORGANISM="Strombidium inclinatum, Strain S3" /LENGTH=103 /DNA_ID=CAMNT_0010794027 /DNA_START=429 /DNA_END=740 /DNA_ORIENTATION=+